MIINGNRKDLFGGLLADYVLVQDLSNFMRGGQAAAVTGNRTVLNLFTNNIVAEFNTFIANKDRRPGNQLTNFMLALTAK